jgi:hypothetical protein
MYNKAELVLSSSTDVEHYELNTFLLVLFAIKTCINKPSGK